MDERARIVQLEAQLAALQGERGRYREALIFLRDWFGYGQHEHVGQFTGATPRCSPSAWKEIKQTVDAALSPVPASSDGEQETNR